MNKKIIIGIIAVIVVIIASISIFKDSKPEDMKPKYSQKDMDEITDKHFKEQQELKTQIKELKSKVDFYEKEQTRSLQKTTQPSQETPKPQEQLEQEKTKNDPPTTTEYTLQQLKEAFPVGMEFNQYVEKKKTMNVDHPFSISLKKGNVGSVIQGKDGLLVVCVDGNKIFDLKTFSSIDEVKSYEQSLRGK
ncbi:hypothetical protein F8160_00295 [Bacillus sp. CH126_4D]|uniref:hypothetical protein n=1 Tax=unclassified Bacillus (in: firmicutes) TaxID=185979 RepID=UPI00124F3721|nr:MULTISPECIES: hypothetical protein [unclassified Bacillus (in: firmicutes)]KAB2460746.1 hypothetical protein F8162_00625 [Bacillus sp. CH140a_4T]KAB2476453.1 hypothetical protein F8160_00295 [Bacillus sp. CH126_4D]